MIDLAALNPPQREAVLHRGGPLLVLAGAGSGKTRVITYRIAKLLLDGIRPERICALSFTNKAANEMSQRLRALVGKAASKVTCSTFHALGLSMLKAECVPLGFPNGFTIYDYADQIGAVREILRTLKTDEEADRYDPKALLFRIGRAKNQLRSPEEYAAEIEASRSARVGRYDEMATQVYARYREALRAFHAVDFDDLICEPVRLMDEDLGVRTRWMNRFDTLLVDEFQDTNRVQLRLLLRLASGGAEVCVVGDDDQSIYGWRGAEAANILEFERHFSGAKLIKLEENYRSTQAILDCANAVIRANAKRYDKTLFTSKAGGARPVEVVLPGADGEARYVAGEIQSLVLQRRFQYRDVAILYRSNLQARLFEEELRERTVPYVMFGGQQFYERKEVKDVVAYLRLALNPRDEVSLRRIVNYPARGIGPAALEKATAFASRQRVTLYDAVARYRELDELPARSREGMRELTALLERHGARLRGEGGFAEGARALVDELGLFDDLREAAPTATAAQRRIDNVQELLGSLTTYEQRHGTARLSQFLARLALTSGADGDEEDPEKRGDHVTMTTLHGAKGLEFPVVFLVGLEEELLPHARTLSPQSHDLQDPEAATDLSEERRLCYVGITRARERLYLTRAATRRKNNKEQPRTVSRFLQDIPDVLLERRVEDQPGTPEEESATRTAALEELWRLVE
jgi:DNA helicase-2/ATP-dependent DNA helicase PcrA